MPVFALVDCNNFYCSCERVFNPQLENQPVIVLSNNDGCVVSRSNEAKALKIKMGEPYFKCLDIIEKNHVHVFSSNYELYGDMSARVMTLLQEFCPEIEIYSIDEAFLSLDTFDHYDLENYAQRIRQEIKMTLSMPVSIGIAPTKTLAKIANHIAKKQMASGIFNLCDKETQNQTLAAFPVEEIWGVGRRIAARLKNFKIFTALDLKNADPKTLRREFSVVMEKMIAELNNESCLPLESLSPPKKQIMSSRSFGQPIVTLADLAEAVSTYAARAATKLRRQKSVAAGIHVFVQTNPFRDDQKQYNGAFSHSFIHPSADTRTIIKQALLCLKKIYRAGYQYKKAGIMLLGLMPQSIQQFDLLNAVKAGNSEALMNTLDKINQRFGEKSLFVGAEGTTNSWRMKRNKISKRFTTRWQELPIVNCK